MSIISYFFDLRKALEEAWRRFENRDVQKRVEEIFTAASLEIPLRNIVESNGPTPILMRHLAAARLEEIQFKLRCEEIDVKGYIISYERDLFVVENPSKRRLVEIRTYNGRGRNRGIREKVLRLVDISRNSGRPLNCVMTIGGKKLVDFHRRTFDLLVSLPTIDLSDWLIKVGGNSSRKAQKYYPLIFLLSAAGRLIIFESFESPGFPHLDSFNREVVIPAWDYARSVVGVEPIVVYHPSQPDPIWGETEEVILKYYPPQVLTFALEEGWV